MSYIRVTCLATGDQIYEWSQQFFKNICKYVFLRFLFSNVFYYIFWGFYIKKCEEMRQIFLKFELSSLLIYFC